MKTHITGAACAPCPDPSTSARADQAARLRYRRHVRAPRALFAAPPAAHLAAPPADLLTLVIADALKRKTQAEIQRAELRDAYQMPVPRDGNRDRDADIRRRESEESHGWDESDGASARAR